MKKYSIIAFIVVVIAVVGFGYYYLYGPCGTIRVQQYKDQATEIMDRWVDAKLVAGSTSRIALAGPLQNLMDIKREAEDVEVPACMFEAHMKLILGMDYGVKAFLQFSSGIDDVSIDIKAGENQHREYQELSAEIKSCAPFCK